MIHLLWSTKNRYPYISHELKPLLLNHIKENSIKKGIYIDSLNCVEDHIHLLISMGSDQNISKIAMLIKGESSFWVNKNKLIKQNFEWQDEYIAHSVSESGIEKVRNYIAKQEEHHKKKTFNDEYQEFLKTYNLDENNFG